MRGGMRERDGVGNEERAEVSPQAHSSHQDS